MKRNNAVAVAAVLNNKTDKIVEYGFFALFVVLVVVRYVVGG